MEESARKFNKLIQDMLRAKIGKNKKETETQAKKGDPIFYYDKEYAGMGTYSGTGWSPGYGGVIWLNNAYSCNHKRKHSKLEARKSCMESPYNRFLKIKAGLYEKIKEQIPAFKTDFSRRSEEETKLFLNEVLNYFKEDMETKKKILLAEITYLFAQHNQEGPAKMEEMKPETFLAAQKTLEQKLEDMLLEKEIHEPEDARGSRELITLAENYQVNTERARKILTEKIRNFQKKELKKIKMRKERVREAEKIKEELLF